MNWGSLCSIGLNCVKWLIWWYFRRKQVKRNQVLAPSCPQKPVQHMGYHHPPPKTLSVQRKERRKGHPKRQVSRNDPMTLPAQTACWWKNPNDLHLFPLLLRSRWKRNTGQVKRKGTPKKEMEARVPKTRTRIITSERWIHRRKTQGSVTKKSLRKWSVNIRREKGKKRY